MKRAAAALTSLAAAALLVAFFGCEGGSSGSSRAPVVIKGRTAQAMWARTDEQRRLLPRIRTALVGDSAILLGWSHDRHLHLFSSDGRNGASDACDVAFLDAGGKIVAVDTLPADSVPGVTSPVLARFALLVREGWLKEAGAAVGEAATLPDVVTSSPPDVLPEARLGDASVRIELARTDFDRQRGLMHRPRFGETEGMLFIYPEVKDRLHFWMRNTLVPLDIAFFREDGTFINVVSMDTYPNPATDSTPTADSKDRGRFALEVPKGWFAARGLAGPDGLPSRPLRLETDPPLAKLAAEAK